MESIAGPVASLFFKERFPNMALISNVRASCIDRSSDNLASRQIERSEVIVLCLQTLFASSNLIAAESISHHDGCRSGLRN